MKIPSDQVIIPQDKLTRYLLVHRRRNDKSRFLAQAGFTLENPDLLETAVRQMVRDNEAIVDLENEYGVFWRVEGDLHGPHGILSVVTIWLRQEENGIFRFITLKPTR